jgi:hypothetical protein
VDAGGSIGTNSHRSHVDLDSRRPGWPTEPSRINNRESEKTSSRVVESPFRIPLPIGTPHGDEGRSGCRLTAHRQGEMPSPEMEALPAGPPLLPPVDSQPRPWLVTVGGDSAVAGSSTASVVATDLDDDDDDDDDYGEVHTADQSRRLSDSGIGTMALAYSLELNNLESIVGDGELPTIRRASPGPPELPLANSASTPTHQTEPASSSSSRAVGLPVWIPRVSASPAGSVEMLESLGAIGGTRLVHLPRPRGDDGLERRFEAMPECGAAVNTSAAWPSNTADSPRSAAVLGEGTFEEGFGGGTRVPRAKVAELSADVQSPPPEPLGKPLPLSRLLASVALQRSTSTGSVQFAHSAELAPRSPLPRGSNGTIRMPIELATSPKSLDRLQSWGQPRSSQRRLARPIAAILIYFVAGLLFYTLHEGWSFVDAL